MTPFRQEAPATADARRRAPALSPHDRRQMIVDAVAPLLAEHGADLTSRQIAEAAGVAEGTVFRAFGDKETLIRAAAERFFDEETVVAGLRSIDPEGPLESKLEGVVALMRGRFEGAFRVISALGGYRPGRDRPDADDDGKSQVRRAVDELFARDGAALNWSPDQIMRMVRLISFAASVPEVSGPAPLTDGEIARLLIGGVALPAARPQD